jgi:hypothetical protein
MGSCSARWSITEYSTGGLFLPAFLLASRSGNPQPGQRLTRDPANRLPDGPTTGIKLPLPFPFPPPHQNWDLIRRDAPASTRPSQARVPPPLIPLPRLPSSPAAAAMYNGIGLQTARGSGTNGYVQTNKFLVKYRTSGPPKPPLPGHGDDAGAGLGGMRKPNKEILDHDRKRQVELKLLVLRDALEEQGYTDAEIEERVDEARRAADAEAAAVAEEAGPRALPGRGGYEITYDSLLVS